MGRPRIIGKEFKWITVRMPLKLAGGLYRLAAQRAKLRGNVKHKGIRKGVSEVVREAVAQFIESETKETEEDKKP